MGGYRYVGGVVVCYVCALGFKQMALCLPGLALLCDVSVSTHVCLLPDLPHAPSTSTTRLSPTSDVARQLHPLLQAVQGVLSTPERRVSYAAMALLTLLFFLARLVVLGGVCVCVCVCARARVIAWLERGGEESESVRERE